MTITINWIIPDELVEVDNTVTRELLREIARGRTKPFTIRAPKIDIPYDDLMEMIHMNELRTTPYFDCIIH